MINTIDMPTADGDSFDSLLPRHEQVYDFAQLRTGRTLARVIFSLIHFGSELGQIQTDLGQNTLYPSETLGMDNGDILLPGQPATPSTREQTPIKTTKSNEQYWVRVRAIKRRELSDAQIHGMIPSARPTSRHRHTCLPVLSLLCFRLTPPPPPFPLSHLRIVTSSELKELEDDPEMLIEYSLKLASTYLGIPLFRFKGMTHPLPVCLLCFDYCSICLSLAHSTFRMLYPRIPLIPLLICCVFVGLFV